MYDQSLFLRTLSDFTRVLLTPYDVPTVLDELADHLTDVLDLLGSGVSLVDGGRLRFATAYGPAVAAAERAQDEHQRGPCIDAVHQGGRIAVVEVREFAERWPEYTAAASGLGIRSVASIPMKLEPHTVGALDLYARERRDWAEEDLEAAEVMANMATAYLVNASHHDKQVELNQQLQTALESRVVIEQAKGMVAARKGVSPPAAFEILRAFARERGVTLKAVADAVVTLGLEI